MHTSSTCHRFIQLLTLGGLVAASLCNSPVFASTKTTPPAKSTPAPKAAPAKTGSTGGGGAAGSRTGTSGSGASGGTNRPAITTGGGGAGAAGTTHQPITTSTPSTQKPGVTTHAPVSTTPSRPAAPSQGKTPVNNPTQPPMKGTSATNQGKGPATKPSAPPPQKTLKTANGSKSVDSKGNVRNVHDDKRGMDVHHSLNGSRSVSVHRPDGSRVFAERGRAGYIARPYAFHGHSYYARSYGWHGHVYERMYRGYGFRGFDVEVYGPAFYYSPAFYGWAYYPWAAPVTFGWGWGAEPWYNPYGFYFAPYPVYGAPSEWLTDYVISQNLAAAYAVQQAQQTQAAMAQSTGQPVLTPEIKAQIAAEVKTQIQVELAEAQANAQGQEADPESSSINRVFNDGQSHVFIANASLDVTDGTGNECPLSDGDVLQLAPPQAADAKAGNLTVLASKGGKECQQGAMVSVAFTDLQEMQNGMRATVDQGMQKLNEGNGTPKPPMGSSATTASVDAAAAPKPDSDVEAELKRQLAAADDVDKAAAAPAQPNTSMLQYPLGLQSGPSMPDRNGEPVELLAAEAQTPFLNRTRR